MITMITCLILPAPRSVGFAIGADVGVAPGAGVATPGGGLFGAPGIGVDVAFAPPPLAGACATLDGTDEAPPPPPHPASSEEATTTAIRRTTPLTGDKVAGSVPRLN